MPFLLTIVLALQVAGPMVVRDDSVGRRLTPDDLTAIAQFVPAGERIWLIGGIDRVHAVPPQWSVVVFLTPGGASGRVRRGRLIEAAADLSTAERSWAPA